MLNLVCTNQFTPNMKKLLLALPFLFIPIIITAQDDKNFKFGDSFEKVNNHFDTATISYGEFVPNDVTFLWSKDLDDKIPFMDIGCHMTYYFMDDKLEGIRYIAQDKHTALKEYFKEYSRIKTFMSNKYKHIETNEVWEDETYKDDDEKIALAISLGHYEVSTTYSDDEYTIVHAVTKSDSKKKESIPIRHYIVYSTEKFREYNESAKKRRNK